MATLVNAVVPGAVRETTYAPLPLAIASAGT
jgi:hypothetical protein